MVRDRSVYIQPQQRRLAAETAQEREQRLRQLSANQQRRLAAETAQEREQRLRQLSANQQRRLAAETAQEREQRLRQLSANQQRRLAAETAQEREQRLRQLSDNQQRRLAAQTAQEREERLRQLSANHQCRMEEAIHNSCVAPARHNAEHLSSIYMVRGIYMVTGSESGCGVHMVQRAYIKASLSPGSPPSRAYVDYLTFAAVGAPGDRSGRAWSRDLHNDGMVRALYGRRCAIASPFAHVPLRLMLSTYVRTYVLRLASYIAANWTNGRESFYTRL